jgi:hypothetical protein
MASIIYEKALATTTEKSLILGVGDCINRPIALPATWTVIRVGVFWSIVPLNEDDTNNATTETVTYANSRSLLLMGIKDSSSIAPGYAGSKFIGFGSKVADSLTLQTYSGGGRNLAMGGVGYTSRWYPYGANGATLYNSSTSYTTSTYENIRGNPSGLTDFAGFAAVEITVSGGNFSIKGMVTASVTDTSAANLQTQLVSASLNTATTAVNVSAWGQSASDLGVNCFYFRSPFINHRFRIHCHGVRVMA